MSIYIISFLISSGFIGAANNKKIPFTSLGITMGIFVIAFVAGVRDYSIGTDVMTYGNYLFYDALSSNLGEFIKENMFGINSIEPLYLLLTYIISLFSDNPHWLYFIIQFIVSGLVVLRLLDFKEENVMWLGILIFQCLFLGETYNALRQSIAIAILFYGSRFLEKKQIKKYFFSVLLAIGFHKTAIIGIMLYIIFEFLAKYKYNITSQLVIIGITIGIVFFYNTIISTLINVGVLPSKFYRYTQLGKIGFEVNPFIIRLPILFMIGIFYKQYKSKHYSNCFYWVILICEIVMAQLRTISPGIYRISLYLAFYKILAYPLLISSLSNKKNKVIIKLLIVTYCLVTWYYQTVVQGNNEIYPFTSQILNIN